MIYFLECDTAGNICHVCADPMATIVPLVNRVTFGNKDGTPNKDANGNDLAPSGLLLVAPVGITVTTYNMLMSGGLNNYTYNATTETVVPKVAPNAPATTA
jgi:hypothetical protein